MANVYFAVAVHEHATNTGWISDAPIARGMGRLKAMRHIPK
jgi:hypothetical protein